jgi:hypothetical protein
MSSEEKRVAVKVTYVLHQIVTYSVPESSLADIKSANGALEKAEAINAADSYEIESEYEHIKTKSVKILKNYL